MNAFRRWSVLLLVLWFISGVVLYAVGNQERSPEVDDSRTSAVSESKSVVLKALMELEQLQVKGKSPKTGYMRSQFGSGWARERGCDTRNRILARDMLNVEKNEKCQVVSGHLIDPYAGNEIDFIRGQGTSQAVQIDHVVSLSNAWQTGAQQLSENDRVAFANDPRNLLAVDGTANQSKGDGDAATWLPPNKAFRCEYVSKQIEVKSIYGLWVTLPEKNAMARVLDAC